MFQYAAIIKEDYLKQIRKSSKDIIEAKNVSVEKFLFEIILNKQYDQLIEKNKDLNKEICRVIIYGHDLPNTATALNVFYTFILFYIGSQVRIEELVDQLNDSLWDTYFNMCLYFLEGNQLKTKLYKEKFEQILKLSNKSHLESDSQQSQMKLHNFLNANQIIDFLIQVFQNRDNFTENNKKKHFQESYKFLQNHHMLKEIKDKTKELKINIITNAFLSQNYSFLKELEIQDQKLIVQILFDMVLIDYKQLSVFFSRCSDKEKGNNIKYILNRVYLDGDYFKLVQVGRGLKKICEWDRTVDIYSQLISLGQTIKSIQYYSVYLYFTICKIQFMKGQLKKALQTCKLALDKIDEFLQSKQLFYQPNKQRFLQLELLFINLVLVYILRDKKQIIRIINHINLINQEYQKINKAILFNYIFNKNGNLNLIYELFIDDLKIMDLSKIKYQKQNYDIIRKFFANRIELIKSQYKRIENKNYIINTKEIKLKTQCLLELFIITEFVKSQKYQMVKYLNRDQLNLFLNMLRFNELNIDLYLQQQVFNYVISKKHQEQTQESIQDQVFTQIQNKSDFKVRNDIEPLYIEVKYGLAPHYSNLLPQIEKLLFNSSRYEIQSQKLIEGMQVEEVIADGLFSRVNQVIFEGQKYACKNTIIKYNLKAQFVQNQQLEQLNSRLNEINSICQLQDYKIRYVIQIKHLGFQIKQQNKTAFQMLQIFHLSPIYKRLSVILTYSNQFKLQFAEKIAICLKQLQIKRITNFNLNSESLLVDDKNDPVISFGSSINDSIAKQNESSIRSQIFADPEIQKVGKKNRKSDVYSFGILLYYLFVGRMPSEDISQQNRNQFLSHNIHIEEIQKIKIREIQQLMNKCVTSDPDKRYSLSQVLQQFLMMNPCRNDILKLLTVFMVDFHDIDITEEEYELIKQFQKISLTLPLMDRIQIMQDQKLGENLNKCQYQEQGLLFQKFEIATQNQQVAFRQIIQCMRFIRNVIHLNQKCVSNVVAKFYNYQINIQEKGQERLIFFDIFWMDKQYQIDYLNLPQQLINLLKKIREINKEGIFMRALDQQFLYEKNNFDNPVLFNFLYSQREQDDIQKNPYGWQLENQENQNVQQAGIFDEVDLIKAYLRKLLNQFNDEYNTGQLKLIIQELIDKEKQFLTIRSMINHLTLKKIEIIQNSTIYSDRSDINEMCQIAYQMFVPKDPELHNIIQQFLIFSRRFKIESRELNNGMRIYNEKIGSGSYGKVRKVHFQGKNYAQKISKVSYDDVPNQEQISLLKLRLNEINIISQIEDYKIPYVLKNIHIGFVFKQEKTISRIKIYNLTPIYRPFSDIQQSNDLKFKIEFAEKIAVCLKQLENQNISHFVKPNNILVDDNLDPVINGFQISISCFKDSYMLTQAYADPELVSNGMMSRKNNVYTYGITLYELFTCNKPIYEKGVEFLLIQSHLDQIVLIQQREIQQLIVNFTLNEIRIRFSLTQVLFQFLIIHPCRRDIMVFLRVLMEQFEDVDITEQEYDLIKEFQEISLLIPQMNSNDIELVQQLNDTLYKCQYQESPLLVQKYKIVMQDKQLAFRQILQCMRFVISLVNLNKKNLKNIGQFYNYRLFLEDFNQDQLIQFEIFMHNSNYQSTCLTTPSQIISLLNTIQQLNENGFLMMEFSDQFMLYSNNNPIIINFLYSFRQKDDLYKNQYGWPCNYGLQQQELNTSLQLQIIRNQFQILYSHIQRQTQANESNKFFKWILKNIIEKFSDYTQISQIIAEIPIQKQQIIKPQFNQ